MSPEAARLRRALVAAFPEYVHRIIAERGLSEDASVEAAVQDGRDWLADALDDLLNRPAAQQDRSPLQVFRDALGFPTAALAASGAVPVDRDPVDADLFPTDLYGLAPAGSQDLGEEPWRAHVEWGIAKAEAVAGMVPATTSPRPASSHGMSCSRLDGTTISSCRSSFSAKARTSSYSKPASCPRQT